MIHRHGVLLKLIVNSKKNSSAHLRRYIKNLHAEHMSIKRLRVFDFDDTLVVTDAKINVTAGDGTEFSLTPAEFAVYEKRHDDVMDYTEFKQLINPRTVAWTMKMLRIVYDKYGPEGLVILSARSTPDPIEEFLRTHGLTGIQVHALDNANPHAKVQYVDSWIRERGLHFVEFFDDSHKNVAAVRELREMHPTVHVIVRHVIHTHVPTHGFTKHYGTTRALRSSVAKQ